MPVIYKQTVAVLEGSCGDEESDDLLEWLENTPEAKVNLKACQHLHSSMVQVLMVQRPEITLEPGDPEFARWLMPAIRDSKTPSG